MDGFTYVYVLQSKQDPVSALLTWFSHPLTLMFRNRFRYLASGQMPAKKMHIREEP